VAVITAVAEPLIAKAPIVVAGSERSGVGPETISPAGVHGVPKATGTHAPAWMTAADAPEKLIRSKPPKDAATVRVVFALISLSRCQI
jgi:hypothetical protein